MRKAPLALQSLVVALFVGLLCGVYSPSLGAQALAQPLPADIAAKAKAFYEEQSYALALPLFVQLAGLYPAESVDALKARIFELACAIQVREQNRTWDPAEAEFFKETRGEIEKKVRKLGTLGPDARQTWREALELCAVDLRWPKGEWDPLRVLLNSWGQSTSVERARSEYLRIVLAATREGRELSSFHDPERRVWLSNAARIAREPLDVARFNLLLSKVYGHWLMTDPDVQVRRGEALERAAGAGEETPVYAESLWDLGQWAERFGTALYNENGERVFLPDYVRAKEAYERLLRTTGEEWSGWRKRAEQAIQRLERSDLQVLVGHSFRPETEIQFAVRWRNLEAPLVELYRFDPTAEGFLESLMQSEPPARQPETEVPYSQVLEGKPSGLHFPVLESVRLGKTLPPAAYVVVARSGDAVAWAPLFVTNLVLVTHRREDEVIVYAADASSGKPRRDLHLSAEIEVHPRTRDAEVFRDRMVGRTDENGIWTLRWPEHPEGPLTWSIVARSDENDGATRLSSRSWSGKNERLEREVYVITDRSLYQPGDTLHLSGWLRERSDENWKIPDLSREFNYILRSRNGQWESAGALGVNSNGSFMLDVGLPKNAPLGSYALQVIREDEHWNAPRLLFNVEEYRVPEIEASIEVTSPAPLLFGDTIEGTVSVDYYSGGAVEDATVELIVSRSSFEPQYSPGFDEPWFFDHLRGDFAPSSPEEVLRIELSTDARGNAFFSIPTEREGDADWDYQIEARVRDPSRRETISQHSVKVTRQAYFAHLELQHCLIAPGDRAELTVRLEDANGNPVVDDGIIRIVQEQWREVYVHRRRGSEISDEQYRELPDRSMLSAAKSDYRLRESGFMTEEVARFDLTTGEDGIATLSYELPEIGYYNFEWFSRGERGQPVRSEVPLWISESSTIEIGYRPGGVQLIADPGPFVLGEPISVLVSGPIRNRWVLLTASARGILEHRVVRLEGSSALVRFDTDERYQPNFFIDASLVSEESHFVDTLELIVPPLRQYLELSIQTDSDGYEPGDEALVTLRASDAAGNPVQTDLVFGVSDASLYSLLPDPRVPVRKAFFGEKNHRQLAISCSLDDEPFFLPLEVSDEAENDLLEEGGPDVELSAFSVDTASDKGYLITRSTSGLSLESGWTNGAEALSSELRPPFSHSLRRDFRSTLHWAPSVQTDEKGEAQVTFTFSDNLTAWRLQAVAIDGDTRVGEATVRTTTRLPLIARLQLPRFLTEWDTAVVSGVIQNNTHDEVLVTPKLEFEGPLGWSERADVELAVDAGSTARADWTLVAESPGSARLHLSAVSQENGDSVERSLEIVPHGLRKMIGLGGQTDADSIKLKIDLPAVEEREGTRFTLGLSTSLASQLIGALPYLIDYPYGCTEQTISRFLPAVAVRRAAYQLGQPLEILDASVFKALSPEARSGRKDLRAVLGSVTTKSLDRLGAMQKPDGSFPWMPDGPSDPYMTAYAVWALTLAAENEIDIASVRLDDARQWLERILIERDLTPADRCWILLALASRYRADLYGSPSRMEARVFLDLMAQRDQLSAMSLGMLTLTARYYGFEEDTGVLLNNLANSIDLGDGLVTGATDEAGQPLSLPLAHWGKTSGYSSWSEGAVESTAWVLAALLSVDDEHPWVTPVVNWLCRNRNGTYWSNSRATAFTVLALTDYLSHNSDTLRDASFVVSVDDEPLKASHGGEWVSENWAPLEIEIPSSSESGNRVVVQVNRVDAKGPFYYELLAEFFDRSEDILAASSDVAVSRDYWHLKPVSTLLEGVREVMTPLANGGRVATGDRIEVVLRLEVPRDLNYVLIEDLKPAGFEAVQVLSGPSAIARELLMEGHSIAPSGPTGSARSINGYQELRDRKVAFLFDKLPAGTWEVRYRLRAEAPGRFHALPAKVAPMYLPHVGGNSAEAQLEVRDAE